jgi:hypothetical protein
MAFGMKKLFTIALASLLLSACVTSERKNEVTGIYHCPWFHSDTVLTLSTAGDYLLVSATLQDDGIRGNREVGVWARTGRGVTLHPTSNSYSSEFDELRDLTFGVEEGKKLLTPRTKDGDSRKALPFEKEAPNQSPQTTTGSSAPGRV